MSAAKVNGTWPTVRIGEVLRLRAPDVAVEPTQSYQFAGVYCFGRGVFRGQEKQGSEFAYRKLTRVRAGEFVYPKLMAWEGAFGVVPAECDGCHVSPEFPVFEVDSERVLPRFLGLHFQRPAVWATVSGGSTGTNMRRRRLNPTDFLRREIPLPPLAEQQRIADHLDGIFARVARVRVALKENEADADALCRALLFSSRHTVPTPLREIVSQRSPDTAVQSAETYAFAGVYCFGRGIFRSVVKTGADFGYQQLTRVRAGELTYPKLMAWEGAFGIVPQECDGCYVSPEFPVFAVNTERVLPDVLDVYFRTPAIWPEIAGVSAGTNARRRRLQPSTFLAWKFPLPPMEEQHRLRDIKRRVDALRAHHESHRADLDALHRSLLDGAFKGEI